jgi:hypothetical protein
MGEMIENIGGAGSAARFISHQAWFFSTNEENPPDRIEQNAQALVYAHAIHRGAAATD